MNPLRRLHAKIRAHNEAEEREAAVLLAQQREAITRLGWQAIEASFGVAFLGAVITFAITGLLLGYASSIPRAFFLAILGIGALYIVFMRAAKKRAGVVA